MGNKYAIILNGDQSAPHLRIYTSILDENSILYDIISWDRSNSFEKDEFTFSEPLDSTLPSYKKIQYYLRFSVFIKRLVKKYKYEKLIVISPQVALFIPFFLRKKYKNKYIFDYRDLSIEQNKFFMPLFKLVLNNSFINVISSPGFKDYLPKGYNYILSHNFNSSIVESAIAQKAEPPQQGIIKLLTIGAIRIDSNYQVIDALGNTKDLDLVFVGKGDAAPILEQYAKKKGYRNVVFKGRYDKKDEGGIIKQHTMVNIFYPKIPTHISALSNRFYNSLIYKRPMLVTRGGTQGYYVEKYGVGLSVDDCHDLAEQIKEYIEKLDFASYEQRCNELLKEFIGDYVYFKGEVTRFLKN